MWNESAASKFFEVDSLPVQADNSALVIIS
jgi:hypothetical protein